MSPLASLVHVSLLEISWCGLSLVDSSNSMYILSARPNQARIYVLEEET